MSLCFMFYVFTELIKTCLKVRTCICWVPEYKSQCKLALQSCCQSSHCNCTTFLWNSSKTVMTMKPLPSNSAWMCDLVTQEEREGGAEAKEKQSQKEKMFLPGGCSWCSCWEVFLPAMPLSASEQSALCKLDETATDRKIADSLKDCCLQQQSDDQQEAMRRSVHSALLEEHLAVQKL